MGNRFYTQDAHNATVKMLFCLSPLVFEKVFVSTFNTMTEHKNDAKCASWKFHNTDLCDHAMLLDRSFAAEGSTLNGDIVHCSTSSFK